MAAERMATTDADNATRAPGFFASLPLLASARDTFDTGRYRRRARRLGAGGDRHRRLHRRHRQGPAQDGQLRRSDGHRGAAQPLRADADPVPVRRRRRGGHGAAGIRRAGARRAGPGSRHGGARFRVDAARRPRAGEGAAALRQRRPRRSIRADARQQLRRLSRRRRRPARGVDPGTRQRRAGCARGHARSLWTTAHRSTWRACPVAGTRCIRLAARCSP